MLVGEFSKQTFVKVNTSNSMISQKDLFEKRYEQISQTDRVGWSDETVCANAIEMYKKLLSSVGVTGGRMLELGCGRGNIALSFAKYGWDVVGVDFSPTAIRWAKEFAILQRVEADFIEGDLSLEWAFESGEFDAVLDANCLHFFHGSARAHYLSEARRVLKDNGTFVISSHVNQPEEKDWETLGYDPIDRVSRRDDVVLNNYRDAAELIEEVAEAGFRILSSVITKDDTEILWMVLRK